MSQAEANKGGNSGNVRIIPIYVEGRDQPVINTNIDVPISTSSSTASASSFSADQHDHPQWGDSHHNNSTQWEHPPTTSRSFGSDLPKHGSFGNDLPKHGSIFERAKDFPVKDFFRRSESPARQIPVFHTTSNHQPQNQFNNQNMRHSPSPSGQYQQQQQQQYQQQQPSHQQTNNDVSHHPPQQQQQTQPNPKEMAIQKIMTINADVAKLMDRVANFQGKNRKDKEYLYLDEMLTQHLIRLDDLDAHGDDIIKQSRRAAIQAINHTIKALEAKVEEALREAENSMQDDEQGSNNSSYDNLKSNSNSSVNKNDNSNNEQNPNQNAKSN